MPKEGILPLTRDFLICEGRPALCQVKPALVVRDLPLTLHFLSPFRTCYFCFLAACERRASPSRRAANPTSRQENDQKVATTHPPRTSASGELTNSFEAQGLLRLPTMAQLKNNIKMPQITFGPKYLSPENIAARGKRIKPTLSGSRPCLGLGLSLCILCLHLWLPHSITILRPQSCPDCGGSYPPGPLLLGAHWGFLPRASAAGGLTVAVVSAIKGKAVSF